MIMEINGRGAISLKDAPLQPLLKGGGGTHIPVVHGIIPRQFPPVLQTDDIVSVSFIAVLLLPGSDHVIGRADNTSQVIHQLLIIADAAEGANFSQFFLLNKYSARLPSLPYMMAERQG
jgi:hypothetical protein